MPNTTIDTLIFPKPPQATAVTNFDELNSLNEDRARWEREVMRFNDDLYNILHSGYLVRDFQVENLSADKITAGIIGVDQVYLFDNKFELNGALQQIIVKDAQGTPVNRVEIGKFGSGSDYGIKIRNSSGTVVFQATSTTFIDGAVITNATISDSKIIGLDGSKLTNGTVTNGKITSLSADKITLSGTLTCSSSGTAINVTSGGVVNLSNGADIIFKASASGNTNYIQFQTSGGSIRGTISFNTTTGDYRINGNGADLVLATTAGGGQNVRIEAANQAILQGGGGLANITVGTNITLNPSSVTSSAGNFRPSANNTYDCGLATFKWANMWTVVDHVGDIEFDNGWRLTEPDKVYENMDSKIGMLLMNDRWEPVAMFDHMGNLWVKGWIKGLHNFLPPTVARRESTDQEEGNGKKETSRLN